MTISVVLADDHVIMRQGLRVLLDKQPGMKVVGEAKDGLVAIKLAEELSPDVVVMDINMPDVDGITATERIAEVAPETRIVALSMSPNKKFVTEMLKAGACGYVLKEYAITELVSAIEAIMAGEIYLCAKTTSLVVEDFVHGSVGNGDLPDSQLTKRQEDILKRLAEGQSSKQIAYEKSLSVKTVDALRRKIMKKLDMDSLAQLVKYAVREGLTNLED
ncbi:MAG: response regulator transcription factor [Planctomycetes bacterium]|nr:response regulator transcription factor [Planctomycetota bacterium]